MRRPEPPHSIEAERAVLGSMMLKDKAARAAMRSLQTNDFYDTSHQMIFLVASQLGIDDKPIDSTTLSTALDAKGYLDRCGGQSYLATLIEQTPTPDNIDAYCTTVKEKSQLRKLHQKLSIADSKVMSGDVKPHEIIGLLKKRFSEISSESTSSILNPTQICEQYLEGVPEGIPTGLKRLDAVMGGIRKGKITTIAALSSHGKTSFGVQIADHAAEQGQGVLFRTLEDDPSTILNKILSRRAMIDGKRLERRELTEDEWKRVTEEMGRFTSSNWRIDNTAYRSIEQEAQLIYSAHDAQPYGLYVLDYLQRIIPRRSQPMREAINEYLKMIEKAAKELNIAVVLLSQLNSKTDRKTPRPMVRDLSESGVILNLSKALIIIYRPKIEDHEAEISESYTELMICKNSFGETGTVPVHMNCPLTSFYDVEKGCEETYTPTRSAAAYNKKGGSRGSERQYEKEEDDPF